MNAFIVVFSMFITFTIGLIFGWYFRGCIIATIKEVIDKANEDFGKEKK